MKNASRSKFLLCFRPVVDMEMDMKGVVVDRSTRRTRSKSIENTKVEELEEEVNVKPPLTKTMSLDRECSMISSQSSKRPRSRHSRTFSRAIRAVVFETILVSNLSLSSWFSYVWETILRVLLFIYRPRRFAKAKLFGKTRSDQNEPIRWTEKSLWVWGLMNWWLHHQKLTVLNQSKSILVRIRTQRNRAWRIKKTLLRNRRRTKWVHVISTPECIFFFLASESQSSGEGSSLFSSPQSGYTSSHGVVQLVITGGRKTWESGRRRSSGNRRGGS